MEGDAMNCKTCRAACALVGSNIEGDCENYVPWSWGDRLRAMNDEELAGAIFDFQIRVLTANPMLERPASREQILASLRRPAPSGPTRASGISKGESHD